METDAIRESMEVAEENSSATTEAPRPQPPASPGPITTPESDEDESGDLPAASLEATDEPTPTPTEAANAEGSDVDQAKQPTKTYRLGEAIVTENFSLAVAHARVQNPDLIDLFGKSAQGENPMLVIRLRATNTHDRKVLHFRPDNPFLRSSFQLEDDVGNFIRGVEYRTGTKVAGALESTTDILPGESATHTQIFTIPPPKTESLTLRVDLKCFGGEGFANFSIKASQIHGFAGQ